MLKKLLFIIFILTLLNFKPALSNNNVCDIDKTENCSSANEKNKYSREANSKFAKYLEEIRKAKLNYEHCKEEKCGCHAPVIKKDLRAFQNGISKDMIDKVKTKGTKYQIVDHRLYRDKDCMFPARCAGIEHFLLELLPKLPNMEFIVNTRDWPQIHKRYGLFGPIFSFSKTSDYSDIMYPAWAFWEGGPAIGLYPRGIGRWDQHRIELATVANHISWNDKLNVAFFRGSRTNSERDPLVLLSREFPDLVDAQYTKNQAWKSEEDTLHVPPAPEVSFKDHCKYKYLFNFRGVAASFRFKHILLCKSLVFHVGNEWLEFFYASLKPWVHYIPVEANTPKENLQELLEFVKEHDDVAQEIAENGFNMIWNNLKMKDISCYWSKLLKRYANLLQFEVILDNNLIEIKNKNY